MSSRTPFWKKSFYCGSDEYCQKCRVCKYLELQEMFHVIGLPAGSTYERDPVVEIFVEKILPKEMIDE